VEAIRRFKYHCQMVLWRPLGGIMVDALESAAAADLDPGTTDVVCAVPLHESRLRERGFNQSELLAEVVAEAMGRPLKPLLERTRPTLPQVELPAQSRRSRAASAVDRRPVYDGRDAGGVRADAAAGGGAGGEGVHPRAAGSAVAFASFDGSRDFSRSAVKHSRGSAIGVQD
jgi:hypothetical protein